MSARFGYGTLTGKVVNNGVSVSGVTVTYYPTQGGGYLGQTQLSTTTDANGTYTFQIPTDIAGTIGGLLTFTYNGQTTPLEHDLYDQSKLDVHSWPFSGKAPLTLPTYDVGDPLIYMYKCDASMTGLFVPMSQASNYCTYNKAASYFDYATGALKTGAAGVHTSGSSPLPTQSAPYASSVKPTGSSKTSLALPLILVGVGLAGLYFILKKHK